MYKLALILLIPFLNMAPTAEKEMEAESLQFTNTLRISTYNIYDDAFVEYDGVKVYFTQSFPYTVYVRVTSNTFNSGVGDYYFFPGQTSQTRSLESDAYGICNNQNTGYITQNLTFTIQGIYRMDGTPVTGVNTAVGSSTGTIGALCNEPPEGGGGTGGGSLGGGN